MNVNNKRLILEQLDAKVKSFNEVAHIPPPGDGWIHGIRTALNMTLGQLAKKMGITSPSLKNFETREKQGNITLNSLKQIASALDMQLVYAIIPKEGSLEEMVDVKAWEKAREIVNRTANTMALEDQANEQERLTLALQDKKKELKNEIPKFLWD
jgi:predicted DNA-binding mobile mystery protein A